MCTGGLKMQDEFNTPIFDKQKYLGIAFATTPYLHYFIDELYAEYEVEAKTCFVNSKYPSMATYATLSTTNSFYLEKAISLILYAESASLEEKIITKLIKKGFKQVHQWAFNAKGEQIILNMAKRYTQDHQKDGLIVSQSEQSIINDLIVLMYLALTYNLRVPFKHPVFNMLYEFIFYEEEGDKQFKEMMRKRMDEMKSIKKEEFKEIKNDFYLSHLRNKKSILFEDIIEGLTIKESKELGLLLPSREESLQNGTFSKRFSAVARLLKYYNIYEDMLSNKEFTLKEIEDVIAIILDNERHYRFPKGERNTFLINAFYFVSLIKEYKETRINYIQKAQNEEASVIIKMKDSIEKDKLQHKQELEAFHKERREAELKDAEQQRQLEEMQKDLAAAQKELAKLKEFEKERIALRNYVYQETSAAKPAPEQERSTEEYVKELFESKHLIVVIGGHPNWQKKMKEIAPFIRYIDVDKPGSLDFLVNKEHHVFINTATNRHSLYERVMSVLAKGESQLYYLNQNNTPARTIQQVYEALINE